jgi:GDPmannose 4,6-dehydratase
MTRRALITGITGQDGYYLSDLLLGQGYQVVGMLRPEPRQNFERIAPLEDRLKLEVADLTDVNSIVELLERVEPDEVYNLAGNSFVPDSWQEPIEAGNVMGLGVVRILEAIRRVNPAIRLCQAGSSEMFGNVRTEPQNEQTPFCPRTPYGAAKLLAHTMIDSYRQRHGLYACTAIAYTHESPLRNKRFVVRKVTHGVARIKLGLDDRIALGNLDACRDWGYAGDFVRGMHLMLQQDRAEDFVLATGVQHSVRDLVETAFDHVGLDWQDHVVIDPAFVRPSEAIVLRGDISKAQRLLGWRPEMSFRQLVEMMVSADIVRAQDEVHGKATC